MPDANAADVVASLYHDWGRELLAEGRPKEARVVLTEYLRRRPDGDASVLDLCEFQERFAALGPEDCAELFQLVPRRSWRSSALQSARNCTIRPWNRCNSFVRGWRGRT